MDTFLLFSGEELLIEQVLQGFVCVVDKELTKSILLENLIDTLAYRLNELQRRPPTSNPKMSSTYLLSIIIHMREGKKRITEEREDELIKIHQ